MEISPPVRPVVQPRKRWVFRVAILCIIAAAGLIGAENILRRQQREIARSTRLDPGLVKHDRELGWRLEPNWSGKQEHHDFSARYSINARGFRGDTPTPPRKSGRKLTVALGDSFTFGLGVNDNETFVHLLDAQSTGGHDYLNAGTPGYSTDQEWLLLEKDIWSLEPQRVLLFVYLGNDLFDNELEVPLQLRTPKPRFDIVGSNLYLRNVPVPLRSEAPIQLWMNTVLGPEISRWSLRTRLDLRYELFRLISPPFPAERDYSTEFAARFAPALALFERIVEGMARSCAARKVEMMVVLIAGRSYFQSPKSAGGQYQDFFCNEVTQRMRRKDIALIPLPTLMQNRFPSEGSKWFFPHDGHLTTVGHKHVAELLASELERRTAHPVN